MKKNDKYTYCDCENYEPVFISKNIKIHNCKYCGHKPQKSVRNGFKKGDNFFRKILNYFS
jgi:hypothetical protein